MMQQFVGAVRRFVQKPAAVYVAVFLTLLAVLSFFSLGNLFTAYKTGAEINNQVTGDDKLESDLIANVLGKDLFVNLNGGMHRLLGQRKMNGVVRLDNGYLVETNGPANAQTLADNAEHIAILQEELATRNIPLLYVLTPFKIQPSDPELPYGITDDTNASLDAFVEQLEQVGVHPLDLRQDFEASGVDPYTLFFRTDHHWNLRGGFLGFTAIARQAETLLDTRVDPALLSTDSYTEKIYPGWHLGSYGQRTGSLFAGGADDFTLMLPDFETDVVQMDTQEEGTFEEILLDTSYLEKKDNTSRYTYDRVLPLGNYRSLTTGCGKKVLFVCDSMGRAVLPYLTLAFGEVRFVDAYNPTLLTPELLDEYQPDLVIVMHFPTLTFNPDYFNFPHVC